MTSNEDRFIMSQARPRTKMALRWMATVGLAGFIVWFSYILQHYLFRGYFSISASELISSFLVVALANSVIWGIHKFIKLRLGEQGRILSITAVIVLVPVLYMVTVVTMARLGPWSPRMGEAVAGCGVITLAVYLLYLLRPLELISRHWALRLSELIPQASTSRLPELVSRRQSAQPGSQLALPGLEAPAGKAVRFSRGSYIAAALWAAAMLFVVFDSGAFSARGFDFFGFFGFLAIPMGVLFGLDWLIGRRQGAA